VKVGDLVKYKTDSDGWRHYDHSDGRGPKIMSTPVMGVIIDTSSNDGSLYEPRDVLVQWQAPLEGETEVTFWHLPETLEVISECK